MEIAQFDPDHEPEFVNTFIAYLAQKGLTVVLGGSDASVSPEAARAALAASPEALGADSADPAPLRTFPTKYRAWRAEAKGGYRSFDSFEDALAYRDEDGSPPIRVDRYTHSVLWWNAEGTGLTWSEVADAIGGQEKPR